MPTATLSSKGQITLPSKVREALRLTTGDQGGFRRRSGWPSAAPASASRRAGPTGPPPPPRLAAGHLSDDGERHYSAGLESLIGLDTNVLVRYLTQDDRRQARRANAIVHETVPPRVGGLDRGSSPALISSVCCIAGTRRSSTPSTCVERLAQPLD